MYVYIHSASIPAAAGRRRKRVILVALAALLLAPSNVFVHVAAFIRVAQHPQDGGQQQQQQPQQRYTLSIRPIKTSLDATVTHDMRRSRAASSSSSAAAGAARRRPATVDDFLIIQQEAKQHLLLQPKQQQPKQEGGREEERQEHLLGGIRDPMAQKVAGVLAEELPELNLEVALEKMRLVFQQVCMYRCIDAPAYAHVNMSTILLFFSIVFIVATCAPCVTYLKQ